MKFISWFATVCSIIGAFLVASKFVLPGYCFFIVGAMGWFYAGMRQKDKALATLNGVFLIANILGFYNAI